MTLRTRTMIGVSIALVASIVWLAWPASDVAGVSARRADSPSNEQVAPLEPSSASERLAAAPEVVVPGPESARKASQAHSSQLVVRVVAKEDGTPVAGVFVTLVPGQGPDENAKRPSVEKEATEAEGTVEFALEAGRSYELMLQHPPLLETRSVEPLVDGELREMVVTIPTRDDTRFIGRVVDRETREPVLAARVQIVTSLPNQVGASAEVDAAGYFELPAATWTRHVAKVSAEGWSSADVQVDHQHDLRERALEIELARSAAVEVSLSLSGGAPIEGATVKLSADLSGLEREERQEDRALGVFEALDIPQPWSGVGMTDAHGACRIDSVPARVPIELHVFREGALPRREPETFVLAPGETKHVALLVGDRLTIFGRVEDQHGAPLGERYVWRVAATAQSRAYFDPETKPMERAQVDAAGHFELKDVEPGDWWVGLAPDLRVQTPKPDGLAASTATLLHVPGQLGELIVVAERDLYISGRVLSPTLEPQKGAWITAIWSDGVGERREFSDEQGRFQLGPLAGGTWRVYAWRSAQGSAEIAAVAAGTRDLDLVLRPDARIVCAVVGRDGQAPPHAVLLVSSQDANDRFTIAAATTKAIDLRLSDAGTYSFGARTKDSFGMLEGVRVERGATLDDLTIELQPGAMLTVLYTGASTDASIDCWRGTLWLGDQDVSAGQERSFVVPPGTIEVRLTEDGRADVQVVKVAIEAGETRTVDVGKR